MISGPKPKPRDQIRHRMPPVHEWLEVPDVPFDGAPKLPPTPRRARPLAPPEPPRPLGRAGRDLWDRAWATANVAPDADRLMQLCEQVDERAALRFRVLDTNDWRDRNSLRMLDAQVTAGLTALANVQDNQRPKTWPAATKRWWAAISRLPHAALWTDAEWQFAMDTASLVSSFHAGDHRLASEIRAREKIMGTTRDSRRDLRIRYVPAVAGPDLEADRSVTAMADYRRSVEA